MSLRKQVTKDTGDVSSGNPQMDDSTQEDEALDDRDNNEELSSSLLSPLTLRGKRRREREDKSKRKEMTEEEMMDLALRLSEQEASISALRRQKEDEAVMKAIQESMDSQTQSCRPPQSQSQSLLADAEASLRICSRRKLLYSNGRAAIDRTLSEDEMRLNRGAERSTDDSWRNKRRKRKEGSPLPEMPDLSQTQKVDSRVSPCSSETMDLHLDSPQSSDSTQIDDCLLPKSPVFPSTGCRAEVQVPRLSQDLLQTCRTSGFVLCSQDSSTQRSFSARPRSPTFPGNLTLSKNATPPKSPIFTGTDDADVNPQRVCDSGFTLSSQESLTLSVRPRSPVFPTSLSPPPQKSPVFSETDGGQTEQSHRASPAVCGSVRRRERPGSTSQSGGKDSEADPPDPHPGAGLRESSQSDTERRHSRAFSGRFLPPDENLKETSRERDSGGAELSSNMTLLWSDEDDNVTPAGSPSLVFPEERPVHPADGRPVSLNHTTADSEGTTGSNGRPSSSSTFTSRKQPVSSQKAVGGASAPPGESAGGSAVYYYWGVPFCPRGLDPDDYTQVILAQMEVYEKSLKQAQRCLLRKAEWGEAILPQPEKSPPSSPSPAEVPQQLPRRRGLRLRSKTLCDAADTPPAEPEGEEDKREDEEEGQRREEEKRDEGQATGSDDCEVCPETQLSDNEDDRTQVLMTDTDTRAQLRPKSPEQPEVEMIVQVDSPAEDELQEEEEEMEVEVEAPVDKQTKEIIPVESSDVGGQEEEEEVEVDPDVEEVKDGGLQRSASPELEPAVVPRVAETSVDCPICQGSFPATEIEMHAAYCDGEEAAAAAGATHQRRPKADHEASSLSPKPRRKRTRRAEATAEESNNFPNAIRNQEKCFVCQKAVPLREYSRHTELCIQRQSSRSTAKENLLSALEKTESRDSEAGPSGSKPQPSDVITLLDDDEEEEAADGGSSAIRISNSPIRAFTPISEATDCLIDFRKQHRPKKPSQRRR